MRKGKLGGVGGKRESNMSAFFFFGIGCKGVRLLQRLCLSTFAPPSDLSIKAKP